MSPTTLSDPTMTGETKQDDNAIPHDQRHPVSSSPRGDDAHPTQVSTDTTTATSGGDDASLTVSFYIMPEDDRFDELFKALEFCPPPGVLRRGVLTTDQRNAIANQYADSICNLAVELAPHTSQKRLDHLHALALVSVLAPNSKKKRETKFAHRQSNDFMPLQQAIDYEHEHLKGSTTFSLFVLVPKAITNLLTTYVYRHMRAEVPDDDWFIRVREILPDALQGALRRYRTRKDDFGELTFAYCFAMGKDDSIIIVGDDSTGTVSHSSPEKVPGGTLS